MDNKKPAEALSQEHLHDKLITSEIRYRRLFESAKDGILILDAQSGKIEDVNPFLIDLLGYTRDEFLNKSVWDIGLFKDIIPNRENFLKLREKKYIRYENLPLQTANGRQVSVEFVSNVYQEDHHDVIQCNIRDITERKRVEARLAESEARYRSLLDNAPDTIARFDRSLRHVFINKKATEELGLPAGHFIGKTNRELGMPDSVVEKWEAGLRAAFQEKKEQVVDIEIETPNGFCYYTSRIVPEFTRDDTADTALSITRNITGHKHIENSLRRSEAKYRAIVEDQTELICRFKPDSSLTFVNNSYCRYFNRSEAELIGRSFLSLIPASDRDKVWEQIEALNHNNKVMTHEHQVILPDGSQGWHQWTNRILLDETSCHPIEYQAVGRDISMYKKTMEELEKAARLESLGLLAGGIAHDFNNLMGGIFGYIDLANCESDKRKSSEYLSNAMSTIERARALTGQLLTFSKSGAPIRKTDHLFPFIQETARFALSGANVSCDFDVPHDLWACNFDKNQIGQVVDNLIINAQQAMPVGGTIELSARNVTLEKKEHPLLTNGNYVKISIKDSGIGIPGELLDKIFNPFFTTKAMGHGLGLATSYSIIKRHGGCIDVESEQGKGSTFHFYLPASTDSVSSPADNPVSAHIGIGTFLVMDDEAGIREAIRIILSSFGYTVACKGNGKDAVEFFAAELKAGRKIAGMIFDLTVPGGMGGKDAVAEIRKLNRDVPVFVASGYAEDPVLKNPADYGFTAGISKPFMISELSEILNRYMKPKQ